MNVARHIQSLEISEQDADFNSRPDTISLPVGPTDFLSPFQSGADLQLTVDYRVTFGFCLADTV